MHDCASPSTRLNGDSEKHRVWEGDTEERAAVSSAQKIKRSLNLHRLFFNTDDCTELLFGGVLRLPEI